MLSRGRKVTVACYYLSVPMEFIKIADAPWQDSAQAGRQANHFLTLVREGVKG